MAETDLECVHYAKADGVATIRLDRPAALNALTVAAKEQLLMGLRQAAADDSVRAVVLTGSGGAFCAGQDLGEHAAFLAAGSDAVERTVREHYNPIVLTITGMAKPVVAAIDGVAAGAGAGLALACDLRVAGRSARLLMAFARVGLAADSGLSWTLPRLVGAAKAAELLLLAEPVDADAASRLGLVTQVVDDADVLPAAQALAARLATGPTTAYAAIKRQLLFAAGHDLAASLENEAVEQQVVGRTADHRVAVEAFLAKRRPAFTGR